MEETKNLNGTEEGGVPVSGVVDAADDEIRKAKELLRANGYVLFGCREAVEKIKQTKISGLNFVKCKWKDFGEWLSVKRAEMKARSDVAAEKRRLAEEAEARRAEAEFARAGTIAECQPAGSDDVPKCAACGAGLVPGARFCRKCGAPVSVQDAPSSTDTQPTIEVPRCASCNAELQSGARFCTNCGAPAPVAGAASAEVPPPQPAVPRCSSCGVELAPDARFCRKCGSPVQRN